MNVTETKGLVIYTDGGCKPARGIGGVGVHGYHFTTVVPKKGLGLGSIVATRRGYFNKADLELLRLEQVQVDRYIDGYKILPPLVTNNIAEMTAMVEMLKYVLFTFPDYQYGSVCIRTDSEVMVKGIKEWLPGWKANNWTKSDGSPVLNQPLWLSIDELLTTLKTMGVPLEIEHVRAHNGEPGNEAADRWASTSILLGNRYYAIQGNEVIARSVKPTKEEIEFKIWPSEVQGYWNAAPEYNRMLHLPKFYFNSNSGSKDISKDGRHVYYVGTHDKVNDMIGAPLSTASYSVVYLKEPVAELESVKEFQNSITPPNVSSFVIGRLDKILASKNLAFIKKYTNQFFNRCPVSRNINIALPNKDLLTEEFVPPLLAFNLVESFKDLQELLDMYLEGGSVIESTDITDILYEQDPTSKKKVVVRLKKDITTATRAITVSVKYTTPATSGTRTLSLPLGISVMNRNDLNALAEKAPRVKVITWPEADRAFRYATIVETEDDIAVIAGIYSNIELLT